MKRGRKPKLIKRHQIGITIENEVDEELNRLVKSTPGRTKSGLINTALRAFYDIDQVDQRIKILHQEFIQADKRLQEIANEQYSLDREAKRESHRKVDARDSLKEIKGEKK